MASREDDEALALQDDELLALEAIYPDRDQVSVQRRGEGSDDRHTVTFALPVVLSKKLGVGISQAASTSSCSPGSLQLAHLPPLTLVVSLPGRYPLKEPPSIKRLAAPWLDHSCKDDAQASWLSSRLSEMWQEMQGEVLWTWGEWLREGWAEEAVAGIGPFASKPEEGSLSFTEPTAVASTTSSSTTRSLSDILLAYDRLASNAAFEGGRFMCSICLDAKRGGACIKLQACSHVFCKGCLTDYLNLHLTEGSLRLATSCPDPSCVTSTARQSNGQAGTSMGSNGQGLLSISEVESILSPSHPELISRLHFLVAKHVAESDPSAVPCPRTGCQTLAPLRPEDRDSTRYQSFRQCPSCSLTFCSWCRHTWHSPNPCRIASSDALLSAYDAASPHERAAMEVRYGKKNLLRLKARFEEDKANRRWLSEHATPCPHCSSPVEKTVGCNHMICSKCQAHFCYLCGTRLNAARPYQHFNTPGAGCYNRLFDGLLPASGAAGGEDEGEGGDEEEEDMAGEGAERREARRRDQEEHLLALAAIQAAWEDEL